MQFPNIQFNFPFNFLKKYPNQKKDKDDFNKSIIHLSFEQDLIHNPDPEEGSYLIVHFCIKDFASTSTGKD